MKIIPHRFLTASLALALISLACAGRLGAQTLLLQYEFNDSGTSTANGVSGGPVANFVDSSGAGVDLHSSGTGASTRGPSNTVGDLAFDNTSATGMGSAGTGGKAVVSGTQIFGGLTQFTVTGWYNASAATGSSGARLFTTNDGREALYFAGATGLTLAVNGANAPTGTTTVSSTNTFTTTGAWVFFAVTYDGTLTSNNVKFYSGGSDSVTGSAIGAGTGSANAGTLAATSTTLNIGGTTANNRPFDGLMDDFRIYSGVLNLAAVEAIRIDGITAIPEPSTFAALVGVAAVGLVALRRRRL